MTPAASHHHQRLLLRVLIDAPEHTVSCFHSKTTPEKQHDARHCKNMTKHEGGCFPGADTAHGASLFGNIWQQVQAVYTCFGMQAVEDVCVRNGSPY